MSHSAGGLAVDLHRDPDGITVIVAGDLDMATAETLVDRVRAAIDDGEATDLVIDLASVRFCDSAGISALVRLRKLVDDRSGQLRVVNPQPAVRQVLALTGLSEYLQVQ